MGQLITPVKSGTYTVIFSGASGACSNPILPTLAAYYMQIENIVTVTISGVVDLDYSLTNTGTFAFTFPIQPIITNSIGLVNLEIDKNINGTIINGNINLLSNDITLIQTAVPFYAQFTYQLN